MSQTDKIGRAGEHYVAGELNRRGAYASPFSGNVPGIDIVATDDRQENMAYVQVKTKQRKSSRWSVSLRHGWDIPGGNQECLCLETCEAKRCAEATVRVRPHTQHHPYATNLLTLPEVPGKEGHYWVFVSLEGLQYWIVPDKVVRRELIRQPHIEYLQQRGGHRPGPKHGSLDARIGEGLVAPYCGQWSALGLGLRDSTT